MEELRVPRDGHTCIVAPAPENGENGPALAFQQPAEKTLFTGSASFRLAAPAKRPLGALSCPGRFADPPNCLPARVRMGSGIPLRGARHYLAISGMLGDCPHMQPLSSNHATLTEVADVIHSQLIPKLMACEPGAFGVADGLATCGTGALLRAKQDGILIAINRTLVENTFAAKGWGKPTDQKVAEILSACFKDRTDLAAILIAQKAKR